LRVFFGKERTKIYFRVFFGKEKTKIYFRVFFGKEKTKIYLRVLFSKEKTKIYLRVLFGKEKTKIYFRAFFSLKELLKVVNTSVNKTSTPTPPIQNSKNITSAFMSQTLSPLIICKDTSRNQEYECTIIVNIIIIIFFDRKPTAKPSGVDKTKTKITERL